MTHLLNDVGRALVMAAGMFWQTGWSLVLGFAVSGLLQTIVPADQMRRALGRAGPREIAIATLAGAASSSCSYASAAIMRTLFKKGASFVASIAFLFASTNLVLELGIILYLLLGWQFMLAEWVGGLVLIAVLSLLVKATLPTAPGGGGAEPRGAGRRPRAYEHDRRGRYLAQAARRAAIRRCASRRTSRWTGGCCGRTSPPAS